MCECGKQPKWPFLRVLFMEKLLVIARRPKWWSSFSCVSLYDACECEKQPRIVISVWTFYEKVVGDRDQNGGRVFLYIFMQRIRVWDTLNSPLLYAKVVCTVIDGENSTAVLIFGHLPTTFV